MGDARGKCTEENSAVLKLIMWLEIGRKRNSFPEN